MVATVLWPAEEKKLNIPYYSKTQSKNIKGLLVGDDDTNSISQYAHRIALDARRDSTRASLRQWYVSFASSQENWRWLIGCG
jgi:hypothetical protein